MVRIKIHLSIMNRLVAKAYLYPRRRYRRLLIRATNYLVGTTGPVFIFGVYASAAHANCSVGMVIKKTGPGRGIGARDILRRARMHP
jgi:hypothetical protein